MEVRTAETSQDLNAAAEDAFCVVAGHGEGEWEALEGRVDRRPRPLCGPGREPAPVGRGARTAGRDGCFRKPTSAGSGPPPGSTSAPRPRWRSRSASSPRSWRSGSAPERARGHSGGGSRRRPMVGIALETSRADELAVDPVCGMSGLPGLAAPRRVWAARPTGSAAPAVRRRSLASGKASDSCVRSRPRPGAVAPYRRAETMKSRRTFFAVVVIASIAAGASTQTPIRARDLGVPFEGEPGPLNAITDVSGLEVGHTTILREEGPVRDRGHRGAAARPDEPGRGVRQLVRPERERGDDRHDVGQRPGDPEGAGAHHEHLQRRRGPRGGDRLGRGESRFFAPGRCRWSPRRGTDS